MKTRDKYKLMRGSGKFRGEGGGGLTTYFCVACEEWSTHRDHDSGVVVVRVVTLGFRSITLEGVNPFHLNFTEGSFIIFEKGGNPQNFD